MIIYIHGFGGSGHGSKAKIFREYFKSVGEDFIAPSLSYVSKLAIETLQELIHSYDGEVYLIGSSLGGFYGTYLSQLPEVKKVILINPATKPTQDKYEGAKLIVEDGGSHSFNGIERHFENIQRFFSDGKNK